MRYKVRRCLEYVYYVYDKQESTYLDAFKSRDGAQLIVDALNSQNKPAKPASAPPHGVRKGKK